MTSQYELSFQDEFYLVVFVLYYIAAILTLLSVLNRINKKCGMPNITYVQRKSEILGAKFKNLVDSFQGHTVWKEVQKGKLG